MKSGGVWRGVKWGSRDQEIREVVLLRTEEYSARQDWIEGVGICSREEVSGICWVLFSGCGFFFIVQVFSVAKDDEDRFRFLVRMGRKMEGGAVES